jgi:LPXTG-site transpeptidase (sortase) family protein
VTETHALIAVDDLGKRREMVAAGVDERLQNAPHDLPEPDTDVAREDRPPTAAVNGEPRVSGHTIHLPHIPLLRLTGVAMIGIAVLIALFVIYLFDFTPLTASRNQQRLTQSLIDDPLARFKLIGGALPPEGRAVAVLEIPALGLHQVVVVGTSAADLTNGPGLMPGSVIPGAAGNSVIAARRVTFGAPFRSIGSLRHGQRIVGVDGAGTFTYRVTRVFTVDAGQKDVVVPTADDRITLVTSDSSAVTSGRLVVEGKLVGRPVAVADSTQAVPSYDLGLTGDTAAGGLAALWSLLTVLVLTVAAYGAWRWRRPWLTYVMAAPVVMTCGLFASESVARALPATF